MASNFVRPPVELDESAGHQEFLDISFAWDSARNSFKYQVTIRDADGATMHVIEADKVRDKTSLSVLIALQLGKDPRFGFGRDQRPYWWVGNRWVPVDKWLMSLDYSLHILVRTSLASREGTLTAETMAAWKANSQYDSDGLDLSALGKAGGVPLEDYVLKLEPGFEQASRSALPHEPSNLNLVAFPIEHASALCSMLVFEPLEGTLLGRFLSTTLTEAQQDLFQRWLGLHLVSNQVPNPEKMLYLWGSGANGKSQLLWLIRGLLGSRACAELRLADLKTSANVELLSGKLAMLGAEANTTTELERLKSIISREPQNVNPKYRDPFTIVPECLITQASNSPPTFGERSDAMARRVISMHLQNSFQQQSERVEDIAGRILKEEPVALLAFALLGAKKVLADGRFVVPAEVEEASKSVVSAGNPFERFVADRIEFGAYEVAIPELYKLYAHWCSNGGGEAFPAKQTVLLDELERIAAKGSRIIKRGRSLSYTPSTWFDSHGNEVHIVPSLTRMKAEVMQGFRVNDKNGLVAGQPLPPGARVAALISA